MNLVEKILAVDNFPVLKTIGAVTGESSFYTISQKILAWSAGAGAIIAFVFLIIGGFLYLTAGGNAEQSKKGLSGILNAVIGLIIISLSYVILLGVVSLIS